MGTEQCVTLRAAETTVDLCAAAEQLDIADLIELHLLAIGAPVERAE